MFAAILIGLVCIVIGLFVGFGRSWLHGYRQSGWGDWLVAEASRDRELARKQDEVLAQMKAASEQDDDVDDVDDDPFRER